MIRRRGVYHIAGYDPIGAAWHRIFKRELATFARTWNVSSEVSDPTPRSLNSNPNWVVTTIASNWQVETIYEPLLWDDIVLADFARPMRWRLTKSIQVFFDFIRSGAVTLYFKANWQYGIFFLFPYLSLFAFAAVALAFAIGVLSFVDLPIVFRVPLAMASAVVVFLTLLRWPGRRWRVQQGLDDWIFSWEYLYHLRPDIDARIERFADELVAQAQRNTLDEIVVVGHSLGATLAIEVVARALARDPDLGRHGPSVCLLTVGSTIPKFTLHPAGERFRGCAARIVSEPSIAWAEYHARADAISFYKFDPVKLSRFYGDPMSGKPLFRRVRLHHMLHLRTYLRYRLKFMRLHYQFVMANERRSTYDYFMMVCGPIPFARAVLTPRGPAELIAADGALIDPAAPVPDMPQAAADAVMPVNNQPMLEVRAP
jgi:pimeloyl-ACP methyl ester carboxylesterase